MNRAITPGDHSRRRRHVDSRSHFACDRFDHGRAHDVGIRRFLAEHRRAGERGTCRTGRASRVRRQDAGVAVPHGPILTAGGYGVNRRDAVSRLSSPDTHVTDMAGWPDGTGDWACSPIALVPHRSGPGPGAGGGGRSRRRHPRVELAGAGTPARSCCADPTFSAPPCAARSSGIGTSCPRGRYSGESATWTSRYS